MDGRAGAREQRNHPRYRVYAAIERRARGEMLCLTVRDLSVGGAWVYAEPHVRPAFTVGSEHGLVLIDVADDTNQATALARVMRHDENGIAFQWSGSSDERAGLLALINRLRRRPQEQKNA
jgi:hypothetical protein